MGRKKGALGTNGLLMNMFCNTLFDLNEVLIKMKNINLTNLINKLLSPFNHSKERFKTIQNKMILL